MNQSNLKLLTKKINEIEELRSKKKKSNKENEIHDNKFQINLLMNIHLPVTIFKKNFRNLLIDFLKNEREGKAFYEFYLESINYQPLLDNKLPYAFKQEDKMMIKLPLETTIIYYKLNDKVKTTLYLKYNIKEDSVEKFATNKIINCNIILNSDQIVEVTSEHPIIKVKQNKIFKHNSIITIKITKFLSNKTENFFSEKINCEGEIVDLIKY